VLWVVKGLGPGGAEHLLAAAARCHDRRRFHIECAYVLPYKDHLTGDLEAAGVVTHCLSRGNRDLRWPLRLARLVRKGGFDVVHVHSPLPASLARLAARGMRSRRPRFVSTEHNGWASFSLPTRLANRFTSRWDDATFAVSEQTQASMAGRAAKRAVTLVHGIDVARTAAFAAERVEVRHQFGVPDDAFVIGTVANFREQKDYPNLLRAARLCVDAGAPLRWLLVGQGPQEQQTRELAQDLGLADVVTFTGFQPDGARIMAAFDVFTMASKWEGLPVALMEALALGLPVVATAVGGVAETMHDGVDAVLVPASDPAALAAGWQKLVADEGLRTAMAAANRVRSAEFDAIRAQRVIEAAYLGDMPVPGGERSAVANARRSHVGLDIRSAVPEDRNAILQLLQRSLGRGDDPRFAELYRWKHDLNAFGPSPTWVVIDAGRVVAVRIFMRWEFVRGGQVLRAARAVDTATDPDYQGKGLFTALTMHGLDEMRADGVDFVFNTPNSLSRPGYLKMGWREVGHLPVAVRPLGPSGVLRMVRSKQSAEHWSQPLDVGVTFDEWAASRTGWRGEPALPIRTLATNTIEAFDRWRFGWPELHYRVVEAHGGAVVVRARHRGAALELVQVASFGLSAAQSDQCLVRVAREVGADFVLRLGAPFVRAGFVPLPGGGPVLTWRELNSSGLPPLSNWRLTMGDVELF
jgi:glycosyltransferase involved in cell wall biosynthesis/GNAT superfamily N-acetyltransferase